MDLTTLLIFIGSIVLLILIHEFGHFVAARVKVEVEEFGIGFRRAPSSFHLAPGTLFL
jgi:membrane-associated protease RseP (regulator of RpoE activity)